MMLSVIDIKLWLSAVVETEVTVGAVVSVLAELAVLLSSDFAHEETITAMLTINTNQDNILFILFPLLKRRRNGTKKSQIKTFQSI